MANIQEKPLVCVIETRRVTYQPKSFLFFEWMVKVSSHKMRNDVFIVTNDEFDSVFINDKEYKAV